MATNNRLVDYNRLLMVKDLAFEAFLTNLQNSSNSYNLECLNECYSKLPIDYRNSDEIYIAGAWNTGTILGYNQSGGIINMPFSRGSVAYGVVNDLVMQTFPINTPSICRLSYNKEYGMPIESERSAMKQSTSGTGAGNQYNTTVSPTSTQIDGFAVIRENNGQNYNNSISAPATSGTGSLPYSNLGGTVPPSNTINSTHLSFFIDVTNMRDDGYVVIYSSTVSQNNRVVFNKQGEALTSLGSGQVISKDIFIKNNRTYLSVILRSDINVPFLSNPRIAIGRLPDLMPYTGDSNYYIKHGWYIYGNSVEDVKKTFIWSNNYNNSSIPVPTKNEDTLIISLTHFSDVFIKTNKGNFEFLNQPIGNFNYKANGIIDCKIYSIAIKYK